MEPSVNHIDELIGKYLAGEATDKEALRVEQWASASKENRIYLKQLKFVFEKASTVKDSQYFDEDAAWSKMKSRLQKKDVKILSFNNEEEVYTPAFKLFWRIAASIVVAAGIGYFVYESTNTTIKEVVAETKSISDKLPEGSDVFLNKKTKLVYAYDKKKKIHVVNLNGEAFFNIKHDEKKNFVIEAEGVYIRDIGTAFNVKAYAKTNTIEVVVKEGTVEFFTDTDSGVFLNAGAKGVYDKETREFRIEQPEPNVLAYKTKFFSFYDQDLNSVVSDLNEVYEKRIILDNKIKNCRLTVTFNNEKIEEIASIIAETLNLSLTTSGNTFFLRGAGCE